MGMNFNRLLDQLKRHEGFRGRPYTDTTGHTTIGYGRNLDANPLTEPEASFLLVGDMAAVVREVSARFPETEGLDEVRLSALQNMAFNLGVPGLSRFTRMWAAIEAHNWPLAADEAKDSLWARQVGGRAHDITYMLRTGEWPEAD